MHVMGIDIDLLVSTLTVRKELITSKSTRTGSLYHALLSNSSKYFMASFLNFSTLGVGISVKHEAY